jgi:hypothetical protein
VRYAANLQFGESWIIMTNTGANGASPLGAGLAGEPGNICVNVYAFVTNFATNMVPVQGPKQPMSNDTNAEQVACCSCLVTPNQIRFLGVVRDITSNTATGVVPTSVTIKLLSTLAGTDGTGTSCTNSAASANTATIVAGMAAWGTTLHATPVSGSFAITETPFASATLSPGELASLANRCAFIVGNLSGSGICANCTAEELGIANHSPNPSIASGNRPYAGYPSFFRKSIKNIEPR